MDQDSRHDIDTLLAIPSNWHVSAYLPTVRAGTDNQQNPIRAKHLLDRAEDELVAQGIRSADARPLLQPGRDLLEDTIFWGAQGDALAIFCAQGLFRAWRLPFSVHEFLWTGKEFYLKPIWPVLTESAEYYLLAISQNHASIYHATPHAMRQVPSEDLPDGMRAALHYDQPEGMIQLHSGQPALRGKESAVFTGQGGRVDVHKNDIVAYFRQIDAALHKMLRQRSAPLVFAGVHYLFPLYQKANTYPHLADTPVDGSPDHLPPHELHERSLRVVQPLLETTRRRDAERYQEAFGRGLSTADVAETVHAAFEGRIDAIFVATDMEAWGQFNPTSFHVQFAPQSDPQTVDLLDLAATEAYRRGARVYAGPAADLPSGQSVATLLRHRIAAATTE